MTRANLRLVYATARRYAHTGVPIEDLIQEGNVGLIKAVDRFDWRRGFRFSTMAVWWIKQQISRSIPDTAFLVRPPVHVHEKLSKLRVLAEKFERANGREPTFAERAAMLGVTLHKFETLVRPSSEPLPIDHADALAALDLDAAPDPMANVADREIELLLSEKLSKLKRKSEAVVRMRTGIGVGEALTLEQVGTAFEVTRERVRQIEAKAMRTLASARSREELAIATGRPGPERDSVADSDRDEDGESVEGEPEAFGMRAELRGAGARSVEASPPREIALSGDPANASALPSSIRKIVDSALALGIEAIVTADEGRARIFVAEVPQSDRYGRKLVRDMLEMGFVREAGKGYRR